MEVNSLFLIIKAKLPARVLHQKRKNWIWYLLCIGSKFTLLQFYFSFSRELWGLWKWVFTNGKYNLRLVALCLLHGNLQVPYWKLFGLLTQTSIFSTSFQMWHNRRKAFFRDCCPRSTSFNDTAIVRNFYPKKFWSRQTFHLLILCNCCCLLRPM